MCATSNLGMIDIRKNKQVKQKTRTNRVTKSDRCTFDFEGRIIMKKLVLFITALAMCLLMTACGKTVENNESNSVDQTVPVESTLPVATEETTTAKVFNSGAEEYSVVLPIYEMVKKTNLAGTYEYSDFKYNEKGQLIEKKDSGMYNGITSYEYDEAGRVISETDTDSNGSQKVEYKYNDQGLLEDTETHKYEYDENGNLIKETVSFPEYSKDLLFFEYNYDENGILVQKIETWYEGNSISSQYIIDKEYDSAGRLVLEAVKDVMDGDTRFNTFEYAAVSSYSISSASDPTLIPATQWKPFSEIDDIPLPDTCITDIRFETKEDNGTAIIYTFALPAAQSDANAAYYKYQSILADVCELTLDTKDDMVYISSNGKLLSLMKAGNDEQYGNFVQISFQSGEKQ